MNQTSLRAGIPETFKRSPWEGSASFFVKKEAKKLYPFGFGVVAAWALLIVVCWLVSARYT